MLHAIRASAAIRQMASAMPGSAFELPAKTADLHQDGKNGKTALTAPVKWNKVEALVRQSQVGTPKAGEIRSLAEVT